MIPGDVMIAGNTVMYAYPAQFIDPAGPTLFEPKEGAKATLNDGTVYSADSVTPIYSGDDLAVYEIKVKR